MRVETLSNLRSLVALNNMHCQICKMSICTLILFVFSPLLLQSGCAVCAIVVIVKATHTSDPDNSAFMTLRRIDGNKLKV